MTELRAQQVAPGVHMLPFPIGQVYLWDWGDGLTVVDSGVPGSAEAILDAVHQLGRTPADVSEIVLTHCHNDHRGSADELAAKTGAEVVAHRLEAPYVRGERPQQPPVLIDFERPIAEMVLASTAGHPGPATDAPDDLEGLARRLVASIAPPPPVPVHRELAEGDTLAGGATVVHIPGHTVGSIAVHLPPTSSRPGVLFTGDTLASVEGRVIAGVFNVDRPALYRSIQRLAALDFEVACFGHGAPVLSSAGQRVRELAASRG